MSESDAQKAHKVFYDAVHAVDETYYSAEKNRLGHPRSMTRQVFADESVQALI